MIKDLFKTKKSKIIGIGLACVVAISAFIGISNDTQVKIYNSDKFYDDFANSVSYNLDDSNLLGLGSFGTVYRGIDRQTNTEVAIKIIPKAKLREEYEQKALQKELDVFSTIAMGTDI